MRYNVCVYLVAGVGGFKNGAKRNVKTDPHRSSPPTPSEIKKPILILTQNPAIK
jgi:hypothetical protein